MRIAWFITHSQILEPIFERRFLPVSYACRTGFGTHRALRDARRAAAENPYVLKCDIRKYFASIDHEILKGQLARVVKCAPTLRLAATVIAASNPREQADWYFPGDDLFTPSERSRGLPLGNQTSQFFANVYLNELDHFIARAIRPSVYLRYVDDFLLFDADKQRLHGALEGIQGFLDGLRLLVHDGKSRIYRAVDGISFLGWRIYPDRALLQRANVIRFRKKLRRLQAAFQNGQVKWAAVRSSVSAWIGHGMHGDTWRLRSQIFDTCPFPSAPAHVDAGSVVNNL